MSQDSGDDEVEEVRRMKEVTTIDRMNASDIGIEFRWQGRLICRKS